MEANLIAESRIQESRLENYPRCTDHIDTYACYSWRFPPYARFVNQGKSVKCPTGVTIIAVLTFFGAAILALSSFAFFFVAIMVMTDGDAGEPISVAIVGMGIAGGTSLLILASVAACLALGVLALREWARIVSMASIAAGMGFTTLSLFVFKGYTVIPVVPSIVCHLLVTATAVWTLTYLLRPRIKRAFGTLAA
jgi:hypothetical protein